MILEKNQALYVPQQNFTTNHRLKRQNATVKASMITNPLMPAEEQCEELLDKLEEKSRALRVEVERLQGISNKATEVSPAMKNIIFEEVEKMLDNFDETNERELDKIEFLTQLSFSSYDEAKIISKRPKFNNFFASQ